MRFSEKIKKVEQSLNDRLGKVDYGKDISAIYIGLVCLSSEFKSFRKIKKPKYNNTDGEGYIEFDLELDYEFLHKTNDLEGLIFIFNSIYGSLSSLESICSKKDFDLSKMIEDMEILIGTCNSTDLNSFSIFPGSNSPQKSNLGLNRIVDLKAFISKEKFLKDNGLNYPGISNELVRMQLIRFVNCFAEGIIDILREGKLEFHNHLAAELKKFDSLKIAYGSEDGDRIALYIEEIMDILNINSSNGILNAWRYGFEIE